MLYYHHSIKDMKTAMAYVTYPENGFVFQLVLDVLLANGQLDEAEKLFVRGNAHTEGGVNVSDCRRFFMAMAGYCEQTGRLSEAKHLRRVIQQIEKIKLKPDEI